MRIQNFVLAFLALYVLSTLNAEALITNNVPSALTGGKSFKLRGPKLKSKSNPFKITIAAYNADGSLGEVLDLTANSSIKKKANGNFVATVTMPNVASDLKILLSVSGGNVAETDPQQFTALLLSDPSADAGVELNNNDGSTFSSSNTTGPQGEKGDTGAPGPAGPQGEPGLVAINGGKVDIDSLFHFENPVLNLRSAKVENGLINVSNSTFFIVTDSDPSTVDIIGNLTGAQNPGQKVTILFEAEAMVTNSEYVTPNSISLHEEPGTPTLSNFKRLSLVPGTRFDNFKPGDTLVLIYDGNSWFEVSRSTTFDPAFDDLRNLTE
jgi:hypothetical protein